MKPFNFRSQHFFRTECFNIVSTGASCHNGFIEKKNVLERSTGHILDVSVNSNSFCVQFSVMTSAVLTRDRVLHYLLRQVKSYSLSFHVIDIFNAINCYIILKGVLLPKTWVSQQHKYLKNGSPESVATKKMALG